MNKILVIEDTKSVLNAVTMILRLENYEILEAENGKEGIEIARKYLPDLIICDIMMPIIDGYGVLNTLRQDKSTANIPFIFLTAKAAKEELRKGMQSGADDYITKPFSSEDIVLTVKSRLDKYKSLNYRNEEKLKVLTNNLSYILPHEFITPITSILGCSELLVDIAETEKIKDIGKRIITSSKRLESLIKNFIIYSKIELIKLNPDVHKKTEISFIPNPGAIIRDIALNSAIKNNRKEDLVFEISEETSIFITEMNLAKVIEELSDNAFKFSTNGTEIKIRTFSENNEYIINISDKGRGMTPENMNNIGSYMQFSRDINEQQGIGLGLIISKKLTELHKGRLEINSNEKGTNIRIKLKKRLLI